MKIFSIEDFSKTDEGRLLLAAVAIITTESRTLNTPYEVIESIIELKEKMYSNESTRDYTFTNELERLINRYSKEKASSTPDYILAEYLVNCLNSFDNATRNRDTHKNSIPIISEINLDELNTHDTHEIH